MEQSRFTASNSLSKIMALQKVYVTSTQRMGLCFVASILFLSGVNKTLSEITAVQGVRLCNDYILK